ncbi:hypothetical protein BJX76DRAFT_333897 [Aspergillus varians]
MKVKQRFTCQTCRRRKLGCDGKRPSCSQCVFSKRRCEGYSTDWSFVHDSRSDSRSFSRSGGIGTAQTQHSQSLDATDRIVQAPLYPARLPLGTDGLVDLIVGSYMPQGESHIPDSSDSKRSRICGSWVEALPDILSETANPSILQAAVRAFATAIHCSGSETTGLTLACTEIYSAAIQGLQRGFLAIDAFSPEELTASVMCLNLVEAMFPDCALGLAAHFKGVEQLFQAHGPARYSSGVLHKLFVGFRPLMVIRALEKRESTFLSDRLWTEIPFLIFSPSPMQSLLNKALPLTALLQNIDIITSMDNPSLDGATSLFTSLIDIRAGLEEWEISLREAIDGPAYWEAPSVGSEISPGNRNTRLWFPNITLANVYTHLWAFSIICRSELENLIDRFPNIACQFSIPRNDFNAEMPVLAEKICSSMEYLLQDEMRLFGPASTFLPLRFAHQAFNRDKVRQNENLQWIRELVARLVAKGLRSTPVMVYSGK